MEQMKTKKE